MRLINDWRACFAFLVISIVSAAVGTSHLAHVMAGVGIGTWFSLLLKAWPTRSRKHLT